MPTKRKMTPYRRACINFRTAEHRRKVKQKCIEYKGGKCEKCGYSRCPAVLSFHHTDPSQKEFGISEKGYTRAFHLILDELNKCLLLCKNCHEELHYAEDMAERARKLDWIRVERQRLPPRKYRHATSASIDS